VLTPGQAHDVQGFGPLFRMVAHRIEALLADKGYDADAIRAEIAAAGVAAPDAEPPAASEPAPTKTQKVKQDFLPLEPSARGRFEKIEPTIVEGEDLDVPTFLRLKVKK
jgi:hypothetical protein